MAALAPPGRLPRWLAPVAVTSALLAIATAAALLAVRGREQAPPRPDAFTPPTADRPAVALDVQQVRDGTLTLAGTAGTTEAALPADAAVYTLRPAAAGDVRAGDWLTAVGIANEVLNFTIRQVVIVPAALSPTADGEGVPRLPSGLAGYEANRDPQERPLIAGRVQRVDGHTVTLTGRGGAVTLDLEGGAPVQRLAAASAAEVREGDRLAYLPARPGAALAEARAVLLLPSGR